MKMVVGFSNDSEMGLSTDINKLAKDNNWNIVQCSLAIRQFDYSSDMYCALVVFDTDK